MASGTSVLRIRIELIFRRCWNPITPWRSAGGLTANVRHGARIGYDPWLMTVGEVRRFTEACKAAGADFVALPDAPSAARK